MDGMTFYKVLAGLTECIGVIGINFRFLIMLLMNSSVA